MQTFGYKIVDKSCDKLQSVLNAALFQKRPLEVGLYFGDKYAWEMIQSSLRGTSIPINTHLDHYRLSLFSIAEHESQLREQINQAQSIGSQYSVTHVHVNPTSQRAEYQDVLAEYLTRQLLALERVCAEYDHPVHIENTYHTLGFYRWLFKLVEKLQLRYVHYCFDLGHAKVWSLETLPDWLAWLSELQDSSKRIHFHLHANNGLADQHLAFTETEMLGLNGVDAYTQKWNYFEALALVRDFFPNTRKVFEVKLSCAIENMELVMERLSNSDDLRRIA